LVRNCKNGGGKTILPQKWSDDVIGLSQAPQKSISGRHFFCYFIWAQKSMGQDLAHNSSFSSISHLIFFYQIGNLNFCPNIFKMAQSSATFSMS